MEAFFSVSILGKGTCRFSSKEALVIRLAYCTLIRGGPLFCTAWVRYIHALVDGHMLEWLAYCLWSQSFCLRMCWQSIWSLYECPDSSMIGLAPAWSYQEWDRVGRWVVFLLLKVIPLVFSTLMVRFLVWHQSCSLVSAPWSGALKV